MSSSTRPALRLLLLALGVALLACLPAGLLTAAFALAPDAIGDPGALTRWGLPVVRVVHDLSWAATVGILLVGCTLVPDDATGTRRAAAARLAAPVALAWAASAVLGLVLTFSDLSGYGALSAELAATFTTAFTFDSLRAMTAVAVLALACAVGASLARGRSATTWTLALALAATFPASLAGHASGAASHDTAVTSLLFHLLGVVVWVGGLLALLVLRPVLPAQVLLVAVRRYSTLAGWCFAAVAASGILNAWVRTGPALATPYGALVGLKALALVVLGILGWRQRRVLVGRLVEGVAGAFARLALLETLVMAVAVGLAVALSRSAPPVGLVQNPSVAEVLTGYPAPPHPTASSWLTTWRVDWMWLTLSLLAIGLYLRGVVILRRRGDRWPVLRTVSWLVGQLLFLATTQGAMGVYGRVLFSWHMLLHMHLAMAVPTFLVLGAPATLLLRTVAPRRDGSYGLREIVLAALHSRWVAVMANPVVAALNFFASLVVFYNTPLFELALRTHTGHVLMVAHFVLAGYTFAWVLVGIDPGPKKWPAPLRLVLLLATLGFHAWFGISIMSGSTLLAPTYYEALRYLPDLLRDQQDGGGIAWGIGEFPSLLLALLVAVDWARSDRRESVQYDRVADRDGDAELRAYNDHLARMSGRPTDS